MTEIVLSLNKSIFSESVVKLATEEAEELLWTIRSSVHIYKHENNKKNNFQTLARIFSSCDPFSDSQWK